ncbi:toprim domain-containing protein [Sphaerimonospora mesophila]|uniref:toprim domain-containing protein n=1 Tax=Sphaerimonospora mesophila TaxID=37483 RepID=UPI0006E2BD53
MVHEVRDAERPQEAERPDAALLDAAARQTSLLRSGQDWAEWLDLASRHRGYGFAALMLIRAARPDATMLAGYESWRRLGRQVAKGERGIRIIQPNTARPTTVFDIAQTTGRPVPDEAAAAVLEPAAALTALSAFAERMGFPVVRSPYAGVAVTVLRNEHGRRFIRIADDAHDAAAVAALAHELGHILLKHPAGVPAVTSPDCGGVWKMEADSVAYLVLRRLGMDPSRIVFPNVSSWAGSDPRAPRFATIRMVGDRILLSATLLTSHLQGASPSAAQAVRHGRTQSAQAEPSDAQTPTTGAAGRPGLPRREGQDVYFEAERFFVGQLGRRWALPYLRTRGIDAATARAWRIGYAPSGRRGLVAHLRGRGYEDMMIEASGLARRRGSRLVDAFQERIVLTLRTEDGDIAGFIARHSPKGRGPKYLANRGSAKGSVLYGLAENRRLLAAGAHPVIVEGPFDAIAVTLAGGGRYAGVATCGTALTTAQVAALAQVADLDAGVVVTFDGDSAGVRGAARVFDLLRSAEAVRLPEGRDPSAILAQDGPVALARLLEGERVPLADVVVDAELDRFPRLRFPEDRMRALQAVAPIVAGLPSGQIARQVVRTATRLNLDVMVVNETVITAIGQAPPNLSRLTTATLSSAAVARLDAPATPPERTHPEPAPKGASSPPRSPARHRRKP